MSAFYVLCRVKLQSHNTTHYHRNKEHFGQGNGFFKKQYIAKFKYDDAGTRPRGKGHTCRDNFYSHREEPRV